MDLSSSIIIVEQCKVSPPQNSVQKATIPLTFFDMPWIFSQVERILFFDFPHPTSYIIEAILPSLKHSLSLSLQHFFPLAGSLVCPPLPLAPHILYQDGDFIPFIVAESKAVFSNMVKNCPRNASEFRPLVPELSNEVVTLSSSDADQVLKKIIRPLIAIQVTIFPNSGISISYTYRHVVGDGRTLNNFIQSWASISKSKNDLSLSMQPCHTRSEIIKDPNGLLDIICNQWCKLGVSWDHFETITGVSKDALQDKLHANFTLNRPEIDTLRNWITLQFEKINEKPPLSHISTFVVSCAFFWVCFIKSDNESLNDDFICHFGFLADFTNRSEFNARKNYFGNYLDLCNVSLPKNELLSEIGLMLAAKAIMKEIKELENGFLQKVESWISKGVEIALSGHLVTVAGSPKLGIYETDFGWGRAKKIEVVHIDKSIGSFSLAESRDEEGGVEIGLALGKARMDAFISIFELGLKNYSC